MNKIVFYNQYYKPLNNPPAKRISAFAEYLSKNGYDVSVITGMPNYPNGKLLKGYKKLFKYELINNVKVNRYFEIPLEIKGVVKPLLNYFSFAIFSLFSISKIKQNDIIYISSPPIFSIYLIFLFSKIFKLKVILEIRDPWPDSLVDLKLLKEHSIIYKILNNFNTLLYKNADKNITISKYLSKYFFENTKIEFSHISNFSKLNKIINNFKEIRIVYLGRLTSIYNIIDYLRAINNLGNIKFDIIGDGELKTEINQFKNINIKYHGYLNENEYRNILLNSNLAIIPPQDSDLNKKAFPSKSYEYFSYGLPVIFNTFIELKELNEEYNFGWYVDNPTQENIENVIKSITLEEIQKKSKNAYKLFQEKFEESIVCEKLYQLIKSLE